MQRIKETFLDLVIYATTVISVFALSAIVVMFVSQPLLSLSYLQSISAVVLTFLFFFIGKIEFDTGEEEY